MNLASIGGILLSYVPVNWRSLPFVPALDTVFFTSAVGAVGQGHPHCKSLESLLLSSDSLIAEIPVETTASFPIFALKYWQ